MPRGKSYTRGSYTPGMKHLRASTVLVAGLTLSGFK